MANPPTNPAHWSASRRGGVRAAQVAGIEAAETRDDAEAITRRRAGWRVGRAL